MSHNITVQGGATVRLPTAGKYCDQDIIVTAEGGSIDLDVVTAASLPSTVVDGQIVIITSTPAGTIYIDTDAPSAPAAGDVWVVLAAGGSAALNITEESPYLRNGLAEAKQWNGGTWDALDGYIGEAAGWVQFAMAIPPIGTPLNDITWPQISTIAQKGLAADYFKVGDTKEIVINGKFGNTDFVNLHIWACIIGIYHNKDVEGEKLIHFQIGKSAQSNGKNLCLQASKYWEAQSSVYFNMNTSATTSGGWKSSVMRTTTLGNNGTPENPASNSLMAALPSDLVSVLKGCNKFTDNTGGSGSASTKVTATTDYIWFPSEFEVFGKTTRSNQGEKDYQVQYDFYKSGNTALRYSHSAQTSALAWWTRSPYAGNTSNFCTSDSAGAAGASGSNYTIAIAPCFCV